MPKVTAAHTLARQQQILLAACICMGRTGFQQMSMKDICRQAELSPGAVYTYFKGKEAILQALAEDGLKNSDIILKEMEAAGGVRAAIHAFFDILEDCVLETHALAPKDLDVNRVKVALWIEVIRDPQIRELFESQHQDVLRRFGRIVRAGKRAGEVNRDVDPKALAQVVISLYEGLTLQRAINPEMNSRKYVKTVFALVDGTLWRNDRGGKEEKE